MMMVSLADMLNPTQLSLVESLWRNKTTDREFHKNLIEQVFTPQGMAQINSRLGQENDPNYLSYAVEYVMNSNSRSRKRDQ